MVVTTRNRWNARRALGGGLVAGLVGGLVLWLFMLIGNWFTGRDVWVAMKGAATPFLGERAQQPGFDAAAVAAGIGCHLLVSAIWGVLFGALFYGLTRGATLLMGVVWGFVVWLGMYYVVLPIVGMGEVPKTVPVGQAILTHLLFGVVLALAFLPFQRRIVRPYRPRGERPVTP